MFCVASSLVLLSLTLVSFQRFESQRLAGRQEHWVIAPCKLNENPKGIPSSQRTSEPPVQDNDERVPSNPNVPPEISISPPSPTSSLLSQTDTSEEETQWCSIAASPPTSMESSDKGDVNTESQGVLYTTTNLSNPIQLTINRIAVKGLEKDDPLGMSVAFFWWLFFLLSRALALITFSQFFPGTTAVVCVGHCLATTAYLLSVSRFPNVGTVAQQVCLGIIYLFCFIEYKTKFNHVKVMYALYFLIVFIENTAVSLVWWFTDDLWDGWWYKYIFLIIFGSYIASMIAMGLYMTFLKPKVTSFYID